MTVELNLVFSQNIYSTVFTLVNRSRVSAADNSEVLRAIEAFIRENLDSFNTAIIDKDVVNRLQDVQFNTVSDFYSLKFMLASYGMDILVNSVAELEQDAEGIDPSIIEYNVIDEISWNNTFVRSASKITMPSDGSGKLSEVYSKIIEGYGLFTGAAVEGFKNPLVQDMELLKQSEDLMGVTPSPVTSDINSIMEYLGKKIIVIKTA